MEIRSKNCLTAQTETISLHDEAIAVNTVIKCTLLKKQILLRMNLLLMIRLTIKDLRMPITMIHIRKLICPIFRKKKRPMSWIKSRNWRTKRMKKKLWMWVTWLKHKMTVTAAVKSFCSTTNCTSMCTTGAMAENWSNRSSIRQFRS